MKELTKKQNEILKYIIKFLSTCEYPPSTRKIGKDIIFIKKKTPLKMVIYFFKINNILLLNRLEKEN